MPQSTHIIIPAGGSSNRFFAGEKKQFFKLGDKTVLNWSLTFFLDQTWVDKIVVCLPNDDLDHASLIKHPKVAYVAGGASRSDSVARGFKVLNALDDDLILIHDAARPFVSVDLVQRVIATAREHGAAIPALSLTDTVKLVSPHGRVVRTLDRSTLRSIQTPQGFKAHLLKKAYAELDFSDPSYTDESLLIEALALPVRVVEGERQNIKITTAFDFLVAEALLRAK